MMKYMIEISDMEMGQNPTNEALADLVRARIRKAKEPKIITSDGELWLKMIERITKLENDFRNRNLAERFHT